MFASPGCEDGSGQEREVSGLREERHTAENARLMGFLELLPYWFSQASFLALTPQLMQEDGDAQNHRTGNTYSICLCDVTQAAIQSRGPQTPEKEYALSLARPEG